MLNETLVRTLSTRYAQLHHTPSAAGKFLELERARGFLWIDGLLKVLTTYESQRDRYHNLEDFMPEIIRQLQQEADNIEERLNRLPRIVSLAPASGSKAVPSGKGELRIVFDRPMRSTSRSIRSFKDGDFPAKLGEPHYEQDGRVFIYPLHFEPGHTYRFVLNGINSPGFVSAEGGYPLDPTPVEFTVSPEKQER